MCSCTEVTFTICPPWPASTMRRAARCAQAKAPVRFRSITCCQSSSGKSRNGWCGPPPALLTKASRPPSSLARASTVSAASSKRVTSSCAVTARPPSAPTSRAVASAPSRSLCQVTPTSNPSRARRTAVAFPIPESDAVTIALLAAMTPAYPVTAMGTRWRSIRFEHELKVALDVRVGEDHLPSGALEAELHQRAAHPHTLEREPVHPPREERPDHPQPAVERVRFQSEAGGEEGGDGAGRPRPQRIGPRGAAVQLEQPRDTPQRPSHVALPLDQRDRGVERLPVRVR